jgi:hypothetical protein
MMKDAREWDESYLLSLPNGEFDWLEIKGRRGLDLTCPGTTEAHVKEILSKAISAFANTGGGRLVCGLAKTDTGWMVDDGGVSLDMRRPTTREWLEDIIPSLVDFPLSSFNVYCVQSSGEDSSIAHDRGVFVIDIGDSEAAPHQANDKRYYARVAGKSLPIPHRLVMDILGRRKHPKIELSFRLEEEFHTPGDFGGTPIEIVDGEPRIRRKTRRVTLWTLATNGGAVFAQYVFCELSVPARMVRKMFYEKLPHLVHEIDGVEYFPIIHRNTEDDVPHKERHGSALHEPILPGLRRAWSDLLREDLKFEEVQDFAIRWVSQADNSPKLSGQIRIGDIPISTNKKT